MKGITHQQMKLIMAHAMISKGKLKRKVTSKARVHAVQLLRFLPMLNSLVHMSNLPSVNFDLMSCILTKVGLRMEPAIIRQSSIKTKYRANKIGTMTDSGCMSRRQSSVNAMLELRVKSSFCSGVSLRQLKGIAC